MSTQTDQVPGHAQSVSTIVAGHDGQQADVAAGMVAIAGVHGVLAPFAYPQEQITRGLGAMLSPDGAHVELIEKIHAATGVRSRNLALELADYADLDDFGAANDVFIGVGVDLGEQAIRGALDKAGLTPEDVDLIVSTSVTGIAAPSLDARLVPRLGLRADVKRMPIFGLGCVAGAAGIARVHDYLLGDPDGVAVLLSVELCSLTVAARGCVDGQRRGQRPVRRRGGRGRDGGSGPGPADGDHRAAGARLAQPDVSRHPADHGLGRSAPAGSGSCCPRRAGGGRPSTWRPTSSASSPITT